MTLRTRVRELVAAGDTGPLDELVAEEPRAIRHLVGCTYQSDPRIRKVACRAIGRAARHHEDLVAQVVRRMVWAMNDESGTNALTAPEVVAAVADEMPRLLLPMVPDLTRLAADEGLHEQLSAVLRGLAETYPGSVGRRIGESLDKEFQRIARERRNKERRKTHGARKKERP